MQTAAVAAYLNAVGGRLVGDGCQVHEEQWYGGRTIIGYRSDFKLAWMATKLHLFTIVGTAPFVPTHGISDFCAVATEYAVQRRGGMRGFQSGVAVLACLVTPAAEPAALTWAQQTQTNRFATMTRPVVVDVERGVVACHTGIPTLGMVYAKHLRTKLTTYFPPPVPAAQYPPAASPGQVPPPVRG